MIIMTGKNIRVTENTYPDNDRIFRAKVGDKVYWRVVWGADCLIRQIDETVVLRSNVCLDVMKTDRGTQRLVGVVAENKEKGWKLKIEARNW